MAAEPDQNEIEQQRLRERMAKLKELPLLGRSRLSGDLARWTLGELILMPQAGLTAQVEEDAYRRKVLDTFLRRGRLTNIPAQLKKRQIVLERLVQEFEPDRTYTEREVNQILVEHHDDVATLRRGMTEHGLVQREGGLYWRGPLAGADPEDQGG